MKKLLFKCALLALVLGALLYAGGEAYKRTNAYRNLEREDGTESYRDLPEAVDIAVFGASHGREDFKFFPEGQAAFNFSLSLQTPEYDLRLMREYQEHIRPGALVVLTVSPIFPFYTQPEEQFREQQPRYYRILSPGNLIDPDLGLYLRGRLSPLLTEDFEDVLAAFFEDEPLEPTIDEESGHKQMTPESAQNRKPNVFSLQIAHVEACFPEANPALEEAYREMLALCQERGWRAVLAVPPYLKEYTDCYTEFSPDYFDVMRGLLEPLAWEYGAAYLDYSRDPDFTGRYDYYRDMSHMNLEGAEAFNRRFFADLGELGLLSGLR